MCCWKVDVVFGLHRGVKLVESQLSVTEVVTGSIVSLALGVAFQGRDAGHDWGATQPFRGSDGGGAGGVGNGIRLRLGEFDFCWFQLVPFGPSWFREQSWFGAWCRRRRDVYGGRRAEATSVTDGASGSCFSAYPESILSSVGGNQPS